MLANSMGPLSARSENLTVAYFIVETRLGMSCAVGPHVRATLVVRVSLADRRRRENPVHFRLCSLLLHARNHD
jgi:hypothetical protein